MKKNRRSSIRKERIIMLASSAFVLAALTMTGLYMRGREVREQDDGYTLDFTALENSADDKLNEIKSKPNKDVSPILPEKTQTNLEDDLDYMPLEAGSGQVEIPGLTDGKKISEEADQLLAEQKKEQQKDPQQEPTAEPAEELEKPEEEALESESYSVAAQELHFSEADKLLKPVSGNVLIPYSMDSSVYFATLDQYKYNPATMYQAEEGAEVSACAAGKVVRVFDDAEIGHALTIELGDGYQVTYGQLTDIQVQEENYVETGDRLGTVAAPTKYYSAEGANLYFRMEKDGQPVDPAILF